MNKNKIFLIKLNELEGRLDPHFYQLIYRKNINTIKNINHQKLGKLVIFSSETWDQKSLFSVEFPYIEIGEIDTITGKINKINYIEVTKAPSRAKMIIRKDDILISTTRPDRGAITQIKEIENICIASTGFSVIRGDVGYKINKDYLFYTLRQKYTLLQMSQRSSGGNYPAITQEELSKILIPIPSLEIQSQIIGIMDNAYTTKKQKEAEAQTLLNSIDDYLLEELGIELPQPEENTVANRIFYHKLSDISGGRFDPFHHSENIHKLKESLINNWGLHFLKEIIEDMYRYPTFYDIVYQEIGIPVIKGENIDKYGQIRLDQDFDCIDLNTHNKYFRTHLHENDLVFTVRGIIGKVGLFKGFDSLANINANVMKIRLNNKVNYKFYWNYLNSVIGKSLIKNLESGQVQKTITVRDINNIIIPIPPLEKQNEIAKNITKIREKAKQLQKEANMQLEDAKIEVEKMILGD